MNFQEQLASTRANLEKLEKLAAQCPDLFEHGHLISVNPCEVQVYVHAHNRPQVDWPAIAAKYRQWNWQREQSPAYANHYDWRGMLNGITVQMLGAEARPKPQPLFEEVNA